MDRQSPTSMRYSYSNSSVTDSMGISRSLQRSGNYIGSQVLSARHGANEYSHSNNIVDMPIIEHPSQSAYSSSIPSHYMDQGRSIESQRTTIIAHSQQNSAQNQNYQQMNSLQLQNNNVNTSQSVYNYSNANSNTNNNQGMISSMDRTQYEIQIAELKLMIKQQNQQLEDKSKMLEDREELYSKYERCLVQLNKVVLHNTQLQEELNQKNAQISEIQHSRDSVSMSRNNDTSIFEEDKRKKQDQIRRLKDSILVLEKQKDSYKHEMNNRAEQLSQIQMVNIQYENKIVLISQEVERLSSLNRVKNEQKNKLQNENTELRKQIQALKLQVERIGFKKKVQHEQKDSSYLQKLQQLYNNIEHLTKIKIQLQAEVKRLQNEQKNKVQQYTLQIQKYKTEKITHQRQIQDLEIRNKKLSEQLKYLSQNHNSSQMKLSTLSSQTNGLHMKIKQLEEQLRYISHQHQINMQENGQLKNSLARMDEQNKKIRMQADKYQQDCLQLRNSLGRMEEENKKFRTQGEKYQQQSIQLRRKIQQMSVNSERETVNLGQNLKQRDQILKDLQIKYRQSDRRVRQLDGLNKQYENRLRQTQLNYETKLKQFESRYKQFEKVRRQLQGRVQQQQHRNKQYETNVREFELKTKALQKQIKQSQTRNISLVSELQNIQQSYSMLKSNKNIEQQRLRQTFTTNLSSLETELNSVNNYKNELNNKFEQKRQQNIKLAQELQNAKNAKSELENRMRIAESEMNNGKNEYIYLQERYNTLQKQYKQYIQATKDTTYKLTKQQQLMRLNANEELTKKDSQLFEMSSRLQESKATIDSLSAKLQQKLKIVSSQQSEIQQYKHQSIHAEQQLDSIRLDFKNLVQQLQYLKQSNSSKEKSFIQAREQLNINLHERENVLNEKIELIWKLENEVNIGNERCKGMQKQAAIQRENNGKLQKQIAALVQKYRALQRQYRQAQQKYSSIDNQHKMAWQQNQQYKSNIVRVENKYKQLERETNEAIQTNRRLEQRNKVLEREYSQNMGSMGERFRIMEKEYGESRSNYSKLEQSFKAGELQYRQLQHKHRELQMQWEQSEANNAKLVESVKQYEQRAVAVELQSRTVEQSKRQLQHQLLTLRTDNTHLQDQNTLLQNSISRTTESSTQMQYRNRQIEQELYQYKQSLHSLTTKYRTLQLQYTDSKETLRNLQNRYKDIEVRYNELEQQLTKLDAKYKQLIGVHLQSEQEIQGLKEIASKTEQQRYYMEQAKVQDGEYFSEQLKNKDILITNITIQLQNKVRAISEQNTYIASKEQDYNTHIRKYQQNIANLMHQLNSSAHHNTQLINQITALKEAELQNSQLFAKVRGNYEETMRNLTKTLQEKQQLAKTAQLNEQLTRALQQKQYTIKQLNREVQQKQYAIKELQHNLEIYMTKINTLTQEMMHLSQNISQSKYNKEMEIQNVLNAKNLKIQQLEKELIDREDYYRAQVRKMQYQRDQQLRRLQRQGDRKVEENEEMMQRFNQELRKEREEVEKEGERRMREKDEMARRVKEKEEEVRRMEEELRKEEEKYRDLVYRVQGIVMSNQTHYQQILEYLQKILKLNTELIIEIGKNNSNIQYIKEDLHSISYTINNNADSTSHRFNEQIIAQIRDKIYKDAEDNRIRYQEEENKKIVRERQDRKEKQDILDREERIIKYLQEEKEKSRVEREREEKKYRGLEQKIQQYNHNNIELIQKLAYSITESMKENMSMRVQQKGNGNNGNVNGNRQLQNTMGSISDKMENLSRLFVEYNQQYHNNKSVINVLQESVRKLEQTNHMLLMQLEEAKESNRNAELQYRNKLQSMAKSLAEQNSIQSASSQTRIAKEQQMIYESQIERLRIQTQEMKKQFDIAVSQYENTSVSMAKQLECSRNEIARLNTLNQMMVNNMNTTNNSNRNTNTNSSNNGSGVSLENLTNNRSSEDIKIIITKYEAQLQQLSKQIQRLHNVINVDREKYYTMENYVKEVERKSVERDSTESNFNKLHKQISELNSIIKSKNNEIQTLQIKFQSASILSAQNTSAQSYKFQIAQLKNKLKKQQIQNNKLHEEISKSVSIIDNLKNATNAIQKRYLQMVSHSQGVENKIRQLSSKYNTDLLNKASSSNELDIYFKRIQEQNKQLKFRLNQVQQNYQILKQQFNRMEEIIEGLKKDNFELRNKNYDYQVEFQKISYMHQQIGKLNSEYDRVSQNNIQLKQQVNECRFAVGDEATMERRLTENYLTIVLMAAEIQSLRVRIQDGNKDRSLDKRNLNDNFGFIKNSLSRVKSEQHNFRFNSNLEHSQNIDKNRNSQPITFQTIPNLHQQTFPSRPSRMSFNEQNQSTGSMNIPKPSRHLDPSLSSLLRSKQSSRSKSRNKSPKIKIY